MPQTKRIAKTKANVKKKTSAQRSKNKGPLTFLPIKDSEVVRGTSRPGSKSNDERAILDTASKKLEDAVLNMPKLQRVQHSNSSRSH